MTSKISISSEEILNLSVTPKILIPAPGPNKVINLIKVYYVYNFVSSAYVGSLTAVGAYGTIGGASAISSLSIFGYTYSVFGRPAIALSSVTNLANVVDSPVVLYTGGSIALGDGTLDVYITYEVFTL